MTNCKNCGHESHCGVPLRKKFNGRSEFPIDYPVDLQEIEVCKSCRCELCEKEIE
jgi:hypothetical protein